MNANRRQYGICVIITILYLAALTFIFSDPLKENYSMLSSSFGGYLAVFMMCIMLSICLGTITCKYNRKYLILALAGPLVGALFPYSSGSGDLFSNLHEICAYISFSMVNICCFLNIYRYRLKNLKKGTILMNVYIAVFIIDAFLFLDSMGAVAIEQFILLSTILVISHILYE